MRYKAKKLGAQLAMIKRRTVKAASVNADVTTDRGFLGNATFYPTSAHDEKIVSQ